MTTEAKAAAGLWGVIAFACLLLWLADSPDDPDQGEDPVDDDGGDTAVASGSLTGNAAAAETTLLNAYPSAVITSALRDIPSQAHAMATNVALSSQWIVKTYKQSTARDACQAWVDSNPTVNDVASIAAGLQGILEAMSPTDLHALSWHLAGQAFDVQPNSCPQSACQSLVDQHTANGGQATFLTKEGGLLRWHLQFDDASVSTSFVLSVTS